MQADAVFCAGADGLRGNLREAVQHDRFQAVEWVLGRRAISRANHKTVAAAANAGALRHDVQRGAVAVGGKQSRRLVVGIALLADFFGQADRGKRAFFAEAFIVGDWRPLYGSSQSLGRRNRFTKVRPRLVVDWHAHGHVVRMVTDAAFRNGLTERFFQ